MPRLLGRPQMASRGEAIVWKLALLAQASFELFELSSSTRLLKTAVVGLGSFHPTSVPSSGELNHAG
jgi:hypothetical protein